MNKLMILLVSVSAMSLAGCGDDQKAQTSTTENKSVATTDASKPATTDASKPAMTDASKPATTDASKPATTDASKPAVTPDPSKTTTADPAKPVETTAPKPATPASPMMALDPKIQTMIDGLKAKASTMSADEKTKSIADVRSTAETMAKAAGKSDADVKLMGDAAEAAAKSAVGL